MRSSRILLCCALLLLGSCGRPGDRDADAGLERARAGDLGAAATLFESALAENPTQPKALYNLGLLRLAQNQATEAEALFRRFVESRPDDALGHFQHARALIAQKRNADALAALQRAVELGFDDHEALVNGDFDALRPEVPFVMLEVTVAQRRGVKALSGRQPSTPEEARSPAPPIKPPLSQDQFCDPGAPTVLEPPVR